MRNNRTSNLKTKLSETHRLRMPIEEKLTTTSLTFREMNTQLFKPVLKNKTTSQ